MECIFEYILPNSFVERDAWLAQISPKVQTKYGFCRGVVLSATLTGEDIGILLNMGNREQNLENREHAAANTAYSPLPLESGPGGQPVAGDKGWQA